MHILEYAKFSKSEGGHVPQCPIGSDATGREIAECTR